VRDATKEEVEKYRLATIHKRKKPDVDVPGRKSESSTSAVRANKYETDSPAKRDEKSRGQESSRDRERDRGSRDREAEVKESGMSSRDPRREKNTSSVERRRTDEKKDGSRKEKSTSSVERRRTDDKKDERLKGKSTSSVERRRPDDKKDERAKEKEASSTERSRKGDVRDGAEGTHGRVSERRKEKQSDATSLHELDKEERDMRKMEKIQRRIEGRRVAKKLEHSCATKEEAEKAKSSPQSPTGSAIPKTVDVSIGRRAELVGGSAVDKITPLTPRELMAADIEQKERARIWASESTSDTTMVSQSTMDRASVRQKAVNKAADKIKAMSKESAQSLANQDAIASQYPPIIDESVSSTVRLGRALVSGALGKRNEDPKIIVATVELQEFSVVLNSTRRKAKAPVSAPPPNSIESDVNVKEHDEVCMSHSTTDTGVNIDLPGSGQETGAEIMDVDDVRDGMNETGDKCTKEIVAEEMCTAISEPSFPDTPTAPGTVATPVLQRSESTVKDKLVRVPSQKRAACDSVAEMASTTGKVKEMKPQEHRRILCDIDGAELLREELARTNLELASVSFFLGIVCGDRCNTEKDKIISGVAVAEKSIEGNTRSPGKDLQQEQRYVELQRPDRIHDAKSLLTEELSKTKPVEAIATAYGEEACNVDEVEGVTPGRNVKTESQGANASEQELSRVQEGVSTRSLKPTAGRVEVEIDMEIFEESEIVISEDIEMSNAESEDESSSSGSTIDSSGSSESEDSTISTRSQKRPADGSPERRPSVTARKEFSAGCICLSRWKLLVRRVRRMRLQMRYRRWM